MRKSTFLNALLAGIASVALACAPTTALAQHGGGGHGGGGGGGAGGFHGGGGGFHGSGGSYGGGYHGGGYYGGDGGRGGSYGNMRGASPSGRNSGEARPWSGRAEEVPVTPPPAGIRLAPARVRAWPEGRAVGPRLEDQPVE